MSDSPPVGPPLPERYRCERELGRGAYGIVYLAWDHKHDTHVAVKVLAGGSRRRAADRFVDEIKLAAGLSHPNILTIHDSGEVDATPYYVMPYVRGESLRQRLDREGRLPLRDALDITVAVARGLGHAHAHGVIHRDIKPSNLLLDASGHVYVADFGVARGLDRAGLLVVTEERPVGTVAYSSPEQCLGDAELDGRSDLYSLACVLFETLAGRPPFEGRTAAAVTYAHLNAEPPSIRGIRADVPRDVDAALLRALSKDPAERFTTGDDLARALGAGTVLPPFLDALVRWLATWMARVEPRPVRSAAALLAFLAVATVLAWPRYVGTTSLTALRSHRAGLEALDVWDLPRADSLFGLAVAADSSYARAHYMLAQTRSWAGADAAGWRVHAERARSRSARLPRADRDYAEALARLGEGDLTGACELYERLLDDGRQGFAASYGLGECLRANALVVPDSTSTTGWRFETSYWRAIQAYRSAFLALPNEVSGMTSGAFGRLRDVIPVRGNQYRSGRSVDGAPLLGRIHWIDVSESTDRDSIAVWPSETGQAFPGVTRAVDPFLFLRPAFVEIAGAWVERFPRSVEARHAWAHGHEAMGLPERALALVREARALGAAPPADAELAVAEVWLLIKTGLPNDVSSLARAREIARDLLADAASTPILDAADVRGLMALSGHPLRAAGEGAADSTVTGGRAAGLIRRAELLEDRLLILSAAGAEPGVLAALEAELESFMALNQRQDEQVVFKNARLQLPAILGFPDFVSRRFADGEMRWANIGLAQWAYARGDGVMADSVIDEIAARRRGLPAVRTTLDVVYPEARLIAALGDSARASAWLGRTLDSLAFSPPGHLRDEPARAAVLVPAMVAMSRLAGSTGAAQVARSWAAGARALWTDGDEVAGRVLARLDR